MRTHRVRDDGPSATMFPFLAVLVCTIGALILLLLVISRQVKAGAAAEAEPEAEVVAAAPAGRDTSELELAVEEARWRIEVRREQRDKTAAELREQRLKLSHVEDHLRRLAEELKQLDADLVRLENGNLADERLAELKKKRAQLVERIALAREQLEKAKRDADTQKPTYAVMPFETSNRTSRRPIYIECTSGQVILQPSGIAFDPEDFEGPLGPGNPLATGLRATREYLAAHEPLSIEAETEPYPLLLVRPGGIDMYYAARAAIKSWGADFGYELVEQDWDLAYPPDDPELTRVVNSAVAVAKRRQQALAQAAPTLFRQGGGAVQYRAAPEGGGVIPDGPYTAGQYADGGPGGQDGFERGGGHGGYENAGHAGGNGGPGGQYGGGEFRGGQPGTSQLGGHGNGLAGRGRSAGELTGDAAHAGAAAGPGGLRSQPLEDMEEGRGAGHGGVGYGGTGGPNRSGSLTADGSSRRESDRLGGASPGRPGESSRHTGHVAGRVAAGRTTQGRATSGALASGQSGSGSQSGGTPSGTGASAASGSAAGSSGTAGPGGQLSLGDAASPETQQRQGFAAQGGSPNQTASQRASSIARSRGTDWALPGKSQGAIAITRPIKARITRHGLKILSRGSSATGRHIEFRGDDRGAVEEFVSSVWDHIDSWGIAGRGFFWRPLVSFEVAPGAEAQYERVHELLDGSGLVVRRQGEDVTAAAER